MTAEAELTVETPKPLSVVRASTLAWGVLAAVFVLFRLAPVWQAPVHGLELEHLSGAWQARIGVGDARFVPTLFQAIAALSLHVTTSAVPARILAFAAAATVPGALYLLRPKLGDAGALVALLLLAFDAPALALGTQGSALGFDLPLTLWLFVLVTRRPASRWLPPLAGFMVATGGPLTLPLVFGWGAAVLWEREEPPPRAALAVAGAVAGGVLVTSFRFGLGWDHLVVAPVRLFSDGYEQRWSTETSADAIAMGSWPILGGSLLAVALRAMSQRIGLFDRHDRVLGGWIAAALAWTLSSAYSHNLVPLVALTTPLAIFLGPAIARGTAIVARADWHIARILLPAAGFAALLAFAVASDWARDGDLPAGQKAFCFLLLGLAVLALIPLAAQRATRPALLAVAAVALVPMIASVPGVALSRPTEPLLSPLVPGQAGVLRAMALDRAAGGGLIVVHPDFSDEVTWPFRDSRTLVVASRVPSNAAIVLWPKDAPKPENMVAVEGNWALTREVVAPSSSVLTYLHWLIDRNLVALQPGRMAVYVRSSP